MLHLLGIDQLLQRLNEVAVISGSGANNFNNLTLTGGGITAAANTAVALAGNLATTGAGTFTHTPGGTGTVTMSGTGKTISGSSITFNNLTLSGTDGTTMTFPSTSASIARIDAVSQTFQGAAVFTAAAPQISLGVNATTLGSIKMYGNTSGDVTM